MLTPDQVDRLQDHLDLFTSILIGGCLLFAVGGVLGVFASQDFANGTNFMMHLAGAEQTIGILMIIPGVIKLRSIHAELERNAPQSATHSSAAGAGH